MRHKSKELTYQQRRFVEEYPIDLNGTHAALRAGYSPASASKRGCFLLRKPEIREAIQEELDRRAQRVHITQDRVLREYARLAFFDPRKLSNGDGSCKDVTELDDDTAAAIAGFHIVETCDKRPQYAGVTRYIRKYRFADKKGALDSIAKHLGMLSERVSFEGAMPVVITGESSLEN